MLALTRRLYLVQHAPPPLLSASVQRFYDSLRQSNQRTIKKISNHDFSMKDAITDYSKARDSHVGSFISQQRAAQAGEAGNGGGTTGSGSVLRVSEHLPADEADAANPVRTSDTGSDAETDASNASKRKRERFVIPI